MPEVLVSDAETSQAVWKATSAKQIRKLAPRLYTRNLVDAPATIIRRNLWNIVDGYFPGALIADRTALENKPASDGSICLIAGKKMQDVHLPGLVLRPRTGPPPLDTDRPFIGKLHLSSPVRAFLENMRPSRTRGGAIRRTLTRHEIEELLDTRIRLGGEEAANRLRDEARAISGTLGMQKEFAQLDSLIGGLLGTRDARLTSPAAVARSRGRPYDPGRIALFDELHRTLRRDAPAIRSPQERPEEGNVTLTFFEAYFSNFIEGTEFTVAEAADIVFNGAIPAERPKDAHDVLGTWRIVSNTDEMSRTPENAGTFVRLLKSRHAEIMSGRPEILPGQFKQKANRVGTTIFVEPELVVGTLEKGLEYCGSLEMPFQRAVFMMFLVSEVHPFADGNGRIARIMTNSELVAAQEERIVIPTVFRSNYLTALRALSQGHSAEPLVRTLDYAQKWTASVRWASLGETAQELEACNAFLDSDVADREGKRLLMPSRAPNAG